MLSQILLTLCFLLPVEVQAVKWNEKESVKAELEGVLKPNSSYIDNVDFWEEDPENSWIVAYNYLSHLQAKSKAFEESKDKKFFDCIGAAYLRMNYGLQCFEDINKQASLIREFEPLIAHFVDIDQLSLNSLWLKGLPEISVDYLKNGMMKIKNTEEVPSKFLTMLPSSYQGKYLLVGGERDNDHFHENKFIINVDKNHCPDMLADGSNAYHFMSLPDNKFDTIEFDHIGHTVLTVTPLGDVLQECNRILSPGGSLIFRTQHWPENCYDALPKIKNKTILDQIRDRLINSNFQVKECKIQKDLDEGWEKAPWYISVKATKKE